MNKQVYEEGKYCMQDVSTLYVGPKYTFDELLEDEEIPFKFRLLADRYLLPESHREDTLETHLYYLDGKSFLVKIYRQLKAKVRINLLEEQTGRDGTMKKAYVTRTITVEELASYTPSEKETLGMVIQELSVSKLALMVF